MHILYAINLLKLLSCFCIGTDSELLFMNFYSNFSIGISYFVKYSEYGYSFYSWKVAKSRISHEPTVGGNLESGQHLKNNFFKYFDVSTIGSHGFLDLY